jgi:hypothetical protein
MTEIGENSFYECSKLININIPDNVISIDDCAFLRCSSLTNIIFSDSSVVKIMDSAFQGCSGLTNINIPDNLTYVCVYAFQDCSGLTNVNIGVGLTSLPNYLFKNCTSLTSITLSAISLVDVPILSYSPIDNTPFSNGDSSAHIFVPSNLLQSYKQDEN